jgi:hypothetical protein
MMRSDRLYRAMLIVYPEEHRRRYGDPMAQLFRDRLRRGDGGIGTARVWVHAGFDLAGSAFKERLETAMNVQTWTNRWWEATVVFYGITQAVMGIVILAFGGHLGWAIGLGFGPAVLLIGGLALRASRRGVATSMIIAGSVLPALAFWMIYSVVLAVIVVFGGLWSGKIGRTRAPEPASV